VSAELGSGPSLKKVGVSDEPHPMTEISCPICKSSNVKLHLDDEDQSLDPSFFGSSRSKITHGRILRCNICEFGFRQVRSNPDEMSELYRKMDITVYESEAAGRRATAARHFALLNRFTKGIPGRLLDVGCASGLFLQEARQHGWSVAGVEPSETLFKKAAAALGGDAELYCSVLEHVDCAPGSFDAVTLWDVLEHVPDPLGFLKTCARLAKPGAKLLLNVPDLDSPAARLLRKNWPLLLAEHLNYFNHGSLRRCAEQAGLKWEYYGRRPVSFSAGYVLTRLAQHRIPGAALLRNVTGRRLGAMTVPIYMGEIFGVWSRQPS
jgi:SAM-dependent methyltransferase